MKDDLYLGRYEVTQEEWEKVMGTNPSAFSRTGRDMDAVKDIKESDLKRFPVDSVSWEDCQDFIKKLNEREKEAGWVYRLPTEAEWEYACRGGPLSDRSQSAFEFYCDKPADQLPLALANYKLPPATALHRTCPVGSYKPNSLGLYDMHGNVAELCDDLKEGEKGPKLQMERGGGWAGDASYCRAGAQHTHTPTYRGNTIGLRLARVPAAPAGK